MAITIYTNIFVNDGIETFNSFADYSDMLDDLIVVQQGGDTYYAPRKGYKATILNWIDPVSYKIIESKTFDYSSEAQEWIENEETEHESDARHNRSCAVPSSIK